MKIERTFSYHFMNMKQLLIAFAVLLISGYGYSQTNIQSAEAKNHIGDSVTVCGKVYGGKFLESAKGTPTFLNVGAPYPNQDLTIVIWEEVRKQFEGKPEELFNGKDICITGKLEMYKGKPQIVLETAAQIKVASQ